MMACRELLYVGDEMAASSGERAVISAHKS